MSQLFRVNEFPILIKSCVFFPQEQAFVDWSVEKDIYILILTDESTLEHESFGFSFECKFLGKWLKTLPITTLKYTPKFLFIWNAVKTLL